MTTIKECMKKLDEITVLDMEASVRDAERIMINSKHDHLPVIDAQNEVFGMLSTFDLIKFLDEKGNPNAGRAWEICSHRLVTCDINISISGAAKMMVDNSLHHLLVKDQNTVVGLVSSWDLASYLIKVEVES
ncbi:MAG: CBS domain-containing protein [Pseudohongiellaceae bacterium]